MLGGSEKIRKEKRVCSTLTPRFNFLIKVTCHKPLGTFRCDDKRLIKQLNKARWLFVYKPSLCTHATVVH